MKRNFLSVIVGLVAAIGTFLIIETLNSQIHPVPSNIDFRDASAVKSFYLNQPLSLWLLVLAGWILGSFLCGLIIQFISKSEHQKLAWIAGSILTLSAVANFFSLPHPTWFIIIGLCVFIPSTLLGFNLIRRNGKS